MFLLYSSVFCHYLQENWNFVKISDLLKYMCSHVNINYNILIVFIIVLSNNILQKVYIILK